MVGKIFITRTGYDPQLGKHVKDPYLGPTPTLGACRPDIRKQLREGDHIFVISGRVPNASQFVMGGFEIAYKVPAEDAFRLFPQLRLRKLQDGQLTGNIIVNSHGEQHRLDDHNNFEARIQNYVVGKNGIVISEPREIEIARKQTVEALQDILHKKGQTPFELVTRFGTKLTEDQVTQLRSWLQSVKNPTNN